MSILLIASVCLGALIVGLLVSKLATDYIESVLEDEDA